MQRLSNSPIGSLVPTVAGQRAFVPNPLPRELNLSSELVGLLDRASRAIARLDGVGETIQNPNLAIGYPMIRHMIRREAVLSSRIEGAVASLSDVFAYEAGGRQSDAGDVREVVDYAVALEWGIRALEDLPISLRLVDQIHARLLDGVRGDSMRTGEFRRKQVWIGPPRSAIGQARFVPPPHERLRDLFLDWEIFANEPLDMPPLVRCALMHYQFEAIHPYEDGNGRTGRLLIMLFLIASGVLSSPLLHLSAYFERDRQLYYDELLAMSAGGDWERWLSYFSTGVLQESRDAAARIRRFRDLRDGYREVLQQRRAPGNALRLVDELFANPIITARGAANALDISMPGARGVLNRLVGEGWARRIENTWPPLYVAHEILSVLDDPIETPNP